jgi:4-diphosphocytidyl-2-C-methyl-D-erythritol kinase
VDKLTLSSYAKLNLYLQIRSRRKDNYHNLLTIFERISLADKIVLKVRRDEKIRIISSCRDIPLDHSNLCAKAARLLQRSAPAGQGADIAILKQIPVGSGMGGGSSNAAATLLGLNRLWGLRLSREKLAVLGAKTGADVPFFLFNCRFAQGAGRGDLIRPLRGLKDLCLWHIIIVPRIKVSTPFIYREWDELAGGEKGKKVKLTQPKYDANILNLALRRRDFSLAQEALFNSLQEVTFRLYPEVRQAVLSLRDLGLKLILMSGSGPAVFGVVSSRKEAVLLAGQLRHAHKSWRVFSAKSV